MTQSKALKTHFRVCNLCEAMCGLKIQYDGQQVISIKGDEKDPFSKGAICPKGAMMGEMYHDPDRLRKPLKKTKNGFVEISWDEALDEVGKKISGIRDQYGNNSIGFYAGNPSVHNFGTMMFIGDLKKVLKTQNAFSATSMDQLPHHFAAYFMFGSGMRVPIPDIDRTDYMILMGANPIASNGSLMTAAGVDKRLKAIQKRGGKYVVIDPRKTETSKSADQHIFIKPATDVYLLLAMLHIVLKERHLDLGHLADHVENLEEIQNIANQYSPENITEVTGIEAKVIRELTEDYLKNERAVIYGRMGVSTQDYGGLCHWLINLLNLLTGHLDTVGGSMFTKPAVPLVREKKGKKVFGRWQSRVRGLPEFEGELPVSTMAEEILTEGDGQIKGLIVNAGNPILSSPNGVQLDEALDSLEFMVSIDIYLNETSRKADIILPPTHGLEIDHYDLVFHALAVSNDTKFSEALFSPQFGQLHDWQILKALTKRLSKKKMPLFHRISTPKMLLNLALLTGPYGKFKSIKNIFSGLSLRKVRKSVHGIKLGPLSRIFPAGLKTHNRKINLAPSLFIAEIGKLNEKFKNETIKLNENEFSMIGRRHLRSNNSWMHNTVKLVSGKNRCTAMIHHEDAHKLGIKNNEEILVKSRVGQIKIPTEITDEIMPGVISIPHGFGHHKKGTQLKVAEAHAGVSVNDITDHLRIDELTGNAAFSGQKVEIAKLH